MECVGARNLAAMAFCLSPSSRLRLRRKKLWRRRGVSSNAIRLRSHSLKLEAKASTGSESCVVAREDFADEEDFVKAGGSELVFVQMQQRKSMEMQSKLADKVFDSKLFFFFLIVVDDDVF
jgi:lycopene epsilon-cyclase